MRSWTTRGLCVAFIRAQVTGGTEGPCVLCEALRSYGGTRAVSEHIIHNP